MNTKVGTTNVILGSKLEVASFSKKMLKNGWTLVKEKEYLGTFLRMQFELKFEKNIVIDDNLEYLTVSTIITKDDLQSFKKKRVLFRHKLKDFDENIEHYEQKGWKVFGKPYKKYREKWHNIPCNLQQIMVRPKNNL